MFRRIWFLFLIAASAVLRPTTAHAAGKPNIVLITLDSTRADRMGFLGSKAKITPNLDLWRARAWFLSKPIPRRR